METNIRIALNEIKIKESSIKPWFTEPEGRPDSWLEIQKRNGLTCKVFNNLLVEYREAIVTSEEPLYNDIHLTIAILENDAQSRTTFKLVPFAWPNEATHNVTEEMLFCIVETFLTKFAKFFKFGTQLLNLPGLDGATYSEALVETPGPKNKQDNTPVINNILETVLKHYGIEKFTPKMDTRKAKDIALLQAKFFADLSYADIKILLSSKAHPSRRLKELLNMCIYQPEEFKILLENNPFPELTYQNILTKLNISILDLC